MKNEVIGTVSVPVLVFVPVLGARRGLVTMTVTT